MVAISKMRKNHRKIKMTKPHKLVSISADLHSKAKVAAAQANATLGQLTEVAFSDLLSNKARLQEIKQKKARLSVSISNSLNVR